MIFPVPQLIAYLKEYFPLRPGDWILTGTPEGVGALKAGDDVAAVIRDQGGKVLSEGAWRVVLAATPADWRQAK